MGTWVPVFAPSRAPLCAWVDCTFSLSGILIPEKALTVSLLSEDEGGWHLRKWAGCTWKSLLFRKSSASGGIAAVLCLRFYSECCSSQINTFSKYPALGL